MRQETRKRLLSTLQLEATFHQPSRLSSVLVPASRPPPTSSRILPPPWQSHNVQYVHKLCASEPHCASDLKHVIGNTAFPCRCLCCKFCVSAAKKSSLAEQEAVARNPEAITNGILLNSSGFARYMLTSRCIFRARVCVHRKAAACSSAPACCRPASSNAQQAFVFPVRLLLFAGIA